MKFMEKKHHVYLSIKTERAAIKTNCKWILIRIILGKLRDGRTGEYFDNLNYSWKSYILKNSFSRR
jgi:hypothetical protein